MELLNIIAKENIIFIILIIILMVNFGIIIYLVIKEKNDNKKEIEEILNDMEENKVSKLIEEKNDSEDKKIEENKKEVEDMLLKMQQDLEAKPVDVVSNFENEQEEKSIISYQELIDSVKEKNNTPSKMTPVKIDIDDTIKMNFIKDTDKKFKNTDFISPIFGKQNNLVNYPKVPKIEKIDLLDEVQFEFDKKEKIEETKIIEKQVKMDQTDYNNEFLNALKEFRKNLD